MSTTTTKQTNAQLLAAVGIRALDSLDVDRIPADVVAAIVKVRKANPGTDSLDWFVAGHEHGYIHSEDGFQLGAEGAYEWPWGTTERFYRNGTKTPGVFIEPVNGWSMGFYPADR